MSDLTFHATPYDIEAEGFYFCTAEDFESMSKTHRNRFGQPVEEYEIQFIDGDDAEVAFFTLAEPNQANIVPLMNFWNDEASSWSDQALAGLAWMLHSGEIDSDQIIEQTEEDCADRVLSTFDGHEANPLRSYAEDFLNDTGALESIPEDLRRYFDFNAYARDMEANGFWRDFTYAGNTYVIAADR